MKKEKILVWGTGVSATNLFNKYLNPEDVYCYIDNDKNRFGDSFLGKSIICPNDICNVDYDLILIASTSSQEIHVQCEELKLDMDRVLFVYRDFKNLQRITSEKANKKAETILGHKWMQCFDYHFRVITENIYFSQCCNKELENTWLKQRDYVRLQTLELLSKEIKSNVEGDIAEFGVYKGEFSRCIQRVFPQRTLFLFDTFDSFGEEENKREVEQGRCNASFVEAFKQTSVDLVRSIFGKEKLDDIHIIQGLFPESMCKYPELEKQKFVFVSIDFDFEDSIYEALKYVYPRLVRGGYIMLHDYNTQLTGVKKAVERYEQMTKQSVCKVPICDEYGTLVITR